MHHPNELTRCGSSGNTLSSHTVLPIPTPDGGSSYGGSSYGGGSYGGCELVAGRVSAPSGPADPLSTLLLCRRRTVRWRRLCVFFPRR